MSPIPNKDTENKKEYLERCMSDDEMIRKHPNEDERFAVCISFWDNE